MLYIKNQSHDPRYNLAFEEYVLKHIAEDEPVLLLWQNEPSVIVGKYQNTIEEINTDFIEKNNINVVRRITGGGAVYHDLGNINYSFIVPAVNETIDFKTFTKPLIAALDSFGIPAQLTGRNDLTVDGCKFSGTAQYFYKNRLLHHGTILFDSNLEDVQKALKVKPGKIESKGIKSVRSRVTNLKPYFHQDITVETFIEKLYSFFQKSYDIHEYRLGPEHDADIRQRVTEQYSTWEWNYGKSPKSNMIRSGYFRCGYIEFHMMIENGFLKETHLIGDFFSSRDIGELENMLKDIPFSGPEVQKVLEQADLKAYLGDITADEIRNTIF